MSTTPTTPVPPPPAEPAEIAWRRREFYLSMISTAGLILGGVWAIIQYIDQHQKESWQREELARKEREQREELARKEREQRDTEAELRRREINLMIYREKKEAYGLLVEAAAGVTTAKDRNEVKARIPKFYAVYFGRVHIVPELDEKVQSAKNNFNKVLEDYLNSDNTADPIETFKSPLYDISAACQIGLDVRKMDEKR